MSHSQLCVSMQFPDIPKEFSKIFQRTPKELPKNSQKVPKKFPKIPKKLLTNYIKISDSRLQVEILFELVLTALQHSELLLNTTSAISLFDRMLAIDRRTIRNRKKREQKKLMLLFHIYSMYFYFVTSSCNKTGKSFSLQGCAFLPDNCLMTA